MTYKIISDSSCDLRKELKTITNIDIVPFYMTIGDQHFTDDDSLDIDDFIKQMNESEDGVRTACASPENFKRALEATDEDEYFIITITSKLSGSYNSAKLAAEDFQKENPDKKLAVFDSKSASAGQIAIILKMIKIIEEDLSFQARVDKIRDMIDKTYTYFILETSENFIKNGRMPKTAGRFVNALNIRPIMKADDGAIAVHQINRGFKNSLNKLAQQIGEDIQDFKERTLVISHVNAMDKAEYLEKLVEDLYDFKEILKVHTRGLASTYAQDGGIIVGY